MAKQKRLSFALQAFVIGLVLVIVLGLTRGIIYEEKLIRAQYIPGTSVIGLSSSVLGENTQLPLDFISATIEKGGMLTEFMPIDISGSYDYLGTTQSYLDTFKPSLRAGRYFTLDEQHLNVCLVSESIAKKLYGTIQNSLGQRLTINLQDASLEIIGVLEDDQELPVQTVDYRGLEQTKFNISSSSFVIYPVSKLQMNQGFGVYRSIWVKGNIQDATHLASFFESYSEGLTFAVNPLPRQVIGDRQTKNLLIVLLGGFAFLVLFVSALGMFGMQMIAVLRRKKEIGLRMAVGARPIDILSQILLESGRLLFLPGVIGIGLGYVLHPFLGKILSLPMLFDSAIILISFIGLTLFTVLVGLYPAWKGANMNPIECLGKTPRLN